MASWAVAAAWVLLYVGHGSAGLFGAEAGSGHDVRGRQLVGTMLAIERATPPTAIVGAPELWPAIPLYTNRLAVPSAPFRPAADEAPVWGDPEAQIELWLAAEVGWVVLEQGGAIHAPTLDRIEAECPGSVTVRARWEGQSLVSLDWDSACRRRLSGG